MLEGRFGLGPTLALLAYTPHAPYTLQTAPLAHTAPVRHTPSPRSCSCSGGASRRRAKLAGPIVPQAEAFEISHERIEQRRFPRDGRVGTGRVGRA
jgi:hypothetical protein